MALHVVTRCDDEDGRETVFLCETKAVAQQVAKHLENGALVNSGRGLDAPLVDIMTVSELVEKNDQLADDPRTEQQVRFDKWLNTARNVITASTQIGEQGWDKGSKRKNVYIT